MIDRRSYINAIESDISSIKTELEGIENEIRKTKERLSWCKENHKFSLWRMLRYELKIYDRQKKDLLMRKKKLQKLRSMGTSYIK